ncbi:MAG: extracellular solute-binding protein [Candidatus Pacebacteria bacterium]|nr:extracellular solute-binding protein [Candidatus Paceibacterota bacterium]
MAAQDQLGGQPNQIGTSGKQGGVPQTALPEKPVLGVEELYAPSDAVLQAGSARQPLNLPPLPFSPQSASIPSRTNQPPPTPVGSSVEPTATGSSKSVLPEKKEPLPVSPEFDKNGSETAGQPSPVIQSEPVTPAKSDKKEEVDTALSISPSGKSSGKILRIFLIFLLFLALAAGFYFLLWPRFQKSDSTEKKPGKNDLVYWGLWEDEEIMKAIIADWEEDHPDVKIDYIRHEKNEYRERLQSSLARGEGPDIFRYHNTWLPMFKEELAPLPAAVMSAAVFEESFYPVAMTDLRIGASIYGLPLEIDTLALFYNEELFRAAGKRPPDDWDQLRSLATELTVRDSQGNIQVAGAAMGGAGNIDHWSDILGLMMLQNGADLSKIGGKLAEDALAFYSYFLRRDKVWDPNFPNSTLAFAGGKAAMYFGFSWDVFEIQRANPDLKFKIVPVPQIPERDPVTWASYWVEGVARSSQSQEAAWDFLKYLTSEAVMRKLYQLQSQTRLFGEPYSRKSLASEIESDPWVGPFISQAPLAQSWYLCSRTFDNGLNKAIIKYFEDAVNAVLQGQDPANVLGTVAKGVSQALALYQAL